MAKGIRGRAAYQRTQRQAWLADTLHEIAVLEGRIMAALGLDLEQLEARLYGGQYLTPREKQDALLKAAVEAGV